ncbi:DNA repair protein RecN [Tyzzerella sp. An114]|uniref:DNA repair protein RecN n=1 Tax=Tyzzerella sp. An114 TaxID=1965545 RepID=UPI000B444E9C|nr:DNA repair protein RecN [Tyzzerella sp. An114]OUQ59908.1 DNA repair protein RecN [Tyzzerella sp. An114]HIT72112.1 DNA repair protein RecN [Candidatus Fimicola cottocaccae]
MLENIRIKNVALIEESEIKFKKGLNILSGETGAGKSMIIDSINFALGSRVTRDFIRKDEEVAKVEVLFSGNKNINDILSENGIDTEEDYSIIINRTFNNSGKSVFRVNGTIVTAGTVKSISENLIDIHGQHEHQSLLNPKKHIFLLDKFCGQNLDEKLSILGDLYSQYKSIVKSIDDLNGDEMQRAQRMDMLRFQKEDIENAKLKRGEEEELNDRRKVLSNLEKVVRLSGTSLELLYEGNGENSSASDNISEALYNINTLSDIDPSVSQIAENLETVSALLDDVCHELKSYFRSVESDPDELVEIDERLNLIYGLKRKYGKNIDEILNFYDKITKELDFMENSEEILSELYSKKSKLENNINSLCDDISKIRKEKALIIEKSVEKELRDLEMKNASFKISITDKNMFTSKGRDNVEFLISPNMGEELKPLAKIASGGEMSRVMLALKSILSEVDTIDTFIFDEIDTGVSGRTAQKVAEKMSQVSIKNQIICITHLPQIAAMADSHFLIEKHSANNRTTTDIIALSKEKSINEIGRLMGGVTITEATLQAAEDMKKQADGFKIGIRLNN